MVLLTPKLFLFSIGLVASFPLLLFYFFSFFFAKGFNNKSQLICYISSVILYSAVTLFSSIYIDRLGGAKFPGRASVNEVRSPIAYIYIYIYMAAETDPEL